MGLGATWDNDRWKRGLSRCSLHVSFNPGHSVSVWFYTRVWSIKEQNDWASDKEEIPFSSWRNLDIGDGTIRLSRNSLTVVDFWGLQAVHNLAFLLSEVLWVPFVTKPLFASHWQIPSGLHLSFCSGVPDLRGLSPSLLLHPFVQFCSPFVASKRSRKLLWSCISFIQYDLLSSLGFFLMDVVPECYGVPVKTSPLTALLFLWCLDLWLPLQWSHTSVEKLQLRPGPHYSSGALDRMPIFVSYSLFLSVDWISACLLPLCTKVLPLLSSSLIFPLFWFLVLVFSYSSGILGCLTIEGLKNKNEPCLF